ncbi:MAG: alginate lyase family protein [Anaerolineae bacterium]|nr:alginate lyase family protein [Anaerolineae bacterium]
MTWFNRLPVALKAARQIGIVPIMYYIIYWFGLKTGHYRRCTPTAENNIRQEEIERIIQYRSHHPLLSTPQQETLQQILGDEAATLLEQANEIVSGKMRLYDADPTPIQFTPPLPLKHWSVTPIETSQFQDIKDIWEPARFGWVFTLGRAYLLSKDEKYPQAFWKHFEVFQQSNPVNLGANWVSAQEVALRIIALAFAWEVFSGSVHTTPARRARLIQSIFDHAMRILPTLPYARAQNNNHLLSEAAGLFTAGIFLQTMPLAEKWHRQGWKIFCRSLQQQIALDGTYIQHSTNYHRMMLQLALWVLALAKNQNLTYPKLVQERLAAATSWILNHFDTISGRVTNLGHNDGAYILPLAAGGISDYRPVVQAASRAFLGIDSLAKGKWDELSQWLGVATPSQQTDSLFPKTEPAWRLGNETCWASLRAVRFHSRPAHADQLHVDLWWNGHNIARDAGTYRYTAAPPWNNSLAGSTVHNTLTVDRCDQMTRAGRFLWLDWAQAKIIHAERDSVTAEHNGYRHLGIIHRRTLSRPNVADWCIQDELLPAAGKKDTHEFTLHWLLPDWSWKINENTLKLLAPCGEITLEMVSSSPHNTIQIIRAGTVLYGKDDELPILGWYSPTYTHKLPALSVVYRVNDVAPLQITSNWFLHAVK